MASNAAAYVAHGINSGVNRFADAMERQKEEEKKNAKEFKSLVDFAEASGLLSKDQAMVMDRDSLKGFVQGKMWAKENEQRQSRVALEKFAADSMRGFQGDYADFTEAYGAGDALGAFNYGVSNNPGANPQDLSAFMLARDRAIPPAGTMVQPGALEKELDLLAKFGVPPAELEKIAVQRVKRDHPSAQERFDLNYSDQLLMKGELDAVNAMAQLGKFNKDGGDKELNRLIGEIEKKYKARARKQAKSPESPKAEATAKKVRVKAPDGRIGFIKESDLEEAKKTGYTLVE